MADNSMAHNAMLARMRLAQRSEGSFESHGERRSSQAHPQSLKKMIESWSVRERPSLEFEEVPSMFVSPQNDMRAVIEIGQGKEKEILSVVFPWFIATVRCSNEVTAKDLKEKLFDSLRKMSAGEHSFCPTDYVLRFFGSNGEYEYIFDESVELGSLEIPNPFPMLFLHEPDDLIHEKELIKDISHAISYPLDDLEMSLDDELHQYRAWLFTITKNTYEERGSEGFNHYAFPEDEVLGEELRCPRNLIAKITASLLFYTVYYRRRDSEIKGSQANAVKLDIEFNPEYTPASIVDRAFEDIRKQGLIDDNDPKNEKFILQLVGKKSYLTSETILLVSYKSVRAVFEDYGTPKFVLRRKSIVTRDYPKPRPLFVPHYMKRELREVPVIPVERPLISGSSDYEAMDVRGATTVVPTFSLWDLDENLCVRPQSCFNLGSTNVESMISTEFTVYCGRSVLVRKMSGRVPATNPRWADDYLPFDLYMKDLPPSAVLGVRLIEWRTNRKENKEEQREIGWATLSLADWKDELRQGQVTLNLYSKNDINDSSKADEFQTRTVTNRLNIDIAMYGRRVRLPSPEQYELLTVERLKWTERDTNIDESYVPEEDDPNIARIVSLLRAHSSGEKIGDEDEKFLWKWRYYLREKYPDSLMALAELDMVWRTREKFSELYVLLAKWKSLSIGTALTLLGKRCTDRVLRRFAAEQLDKLLGNHSFPMYILPLVQALKSEPRAQSDVACLLLRKALADYRIGHKLFWLLRAELAELREVEARSDEYKRIALLIEAYLRGNEEHVRTVVKQVDMVELLSNLSVKVKSYQKDVATRKLREDLRACRSSFGYIDSPLDPSYTLGELIIDKCKVLGSAKMPLRLAWKNMAVMCEHHLPIYEILFKNGDDLRQDMLVLQVLDVMDNIWKIDEFECFLNIYPLLPMGTKIGIIGVVPNCSTIFEIQSEGGKVGTAVKSLETTFLHKFIRQKAERSGGSINYIEAVERFTMSCVGYSVATFIMGIKDRHSDNIMITYDGKLFHIDFGHILGHGKTKLGIQRDRQPFVLTEHFLCVIRRGNGELSKAHELDKFKQLCVDAYLMLWDKRNLFESLFTLMQGMELPELSTDADLDHLKGTLCVNKADREDAEKFFGGKFEEAYNGSWATKTNWFFHAVKHL